jgi:hypothetical protein
MPKTIWQLALHESQAPVTQVLKKVGFRKIGNYYNRTAQDGLIQVVGFQSGQAVSSLHGNFTVNLGVYIPCIAEIEGKAATGRCIWDAHCEIRSRLSNVANLGSDKWWPLDASASQSGQLIANSLLTHGLPFFDQYASKSSIVDRFKSDGTLPFNNSRRSMLAVAIIQWSTGSTNESLGMFEKASTENSNNPRFTEYVQKIKQKCYSENTNFQP